MQIKHNLIPYWTKGIETSEATGRIEVWKAGIKDVWLPHFLKWWGKAHRQEDADDFATMHGADLAIFDCGSKPDRFWVDPREQRREHSKGVLRERFYQANQD